MTRHKTLLSPADQWRRTVEYLYFLHRTKWNTWSHWLESYEYSVRLGAREALSEEALGKLWQKELEQGPRIRGYYDDLWIATRTHHTYIAGDVLIVCGGKNGMMQRWAMCGVTSKGIRLNYCYLPIYNGRAKTGEEVEFPGDFIGLRWDDPGLWRFVADLRASFRSRVGACSPALYTYSGCKTSPGIDTNEITCFGLYKSEGRQPNTRDDHVDYLRFYPNGSVVWTSYFYFREDYLSFDPTQISPGEYYDFTPMGTVHTEGKSVTFELFRRNEIFARYEGQFENGCLWLSCFSPDSDVAHEPVPYRFHPFNPEA